METKDLLTTLGLDPAKIASVDDFKSAVESDFIRKDQIEKTPEIFDRLAGAALGSAQVNFLREIKGVGIDLSKDEIKEKKLSDIFKIAIPKIKETYESKISELEKKAGQGNDDRIKSIESEKEKVLKDYNDLKVVNQSLSSEFETFKSQLAEKEKKSKINSTFDQSYNKISFRDGMTAIDHKGFKAELNDNYQFELSDNDSFVVRDNTGKIVISKKVAGQPATLDEILSYEAEKNNLIKKNNGKTGMTANKTVESTQRNIQSDEDNVVGGRLRKINYAAREGVAQK